MILQAYFRAISKQRNVSLLSVYSSPDGGSRNDVQIAAFCDNTARTVKSPAFL
nr:MAG TPA: hypothetical protein [Caudoviricetes sp.]DAV44211.1 MAG TPA: hypothetical protein [Caudoviricetes sp.]